MARRFVLIISNGNISQCKDLDEATSKVLALLDTKLEFHLDIFHLINNGLLPPNSGPVVELKFERSIMDWIPRD